MVEKTIHFLGYQAELMEAIVNDWLSDEELRERRRDAHARILGKARDELTGDDERALYMRYILERLSAKGG